MTGRFTPGAPDWVYLPVDVPEGVREISVRYAYDATGNALDLGVFDPYGFRGWSGGARDGFTISRSAATPGYLPGPVMPGRWRVVLAPYAVAAGGVDWSVTVSLRFGGPGPAYRPDPAPTGARGRGGGWYRGDTHLHTEHSDGARTPARLAADARAAGLDFIVSTEHNTSSANGVWGAHAGPDLLVVGGEEVTTRDGHFLVLGLPPDGWVDWRYRAADRVLPRVLRAVHDLGALAVAAHPYCPLPGCGWEFGYADGIDAIEVWNGPWTRDDEAALATWDSLLTAGERWIPAVGGSDAHALSDAVGLPHNVVYAEDLTAEAVLAGIRAGRTWLASSSTVDLSFHAARWGVGDRVVGEAPVRVSLTVTGAGGCVARLVTDRGVVVSAPLTDPGGVEWTTTAEASRYVRAEIRAGARAGDTMVALTNPIFLTSG